MSEPTAASPETPGSPGTLAGLPDGAEALVCRIGGRRTVTRRLLEMGLLPGTKVKVIRRAALGDPIEVRLRRYNLSLRLDDGEAIEVLELGDAAPDDADAAEASAPAPARPFPAPDEGGPIRVLLAGNPNAGKTTLFNLLTGARARVGNYPGVTVERKVGPLQLTTTRRLADRDETRTHAAELIDLPGTYSLSARSPEEQVAVDAVLGRHGDAPDVVVVTVDANTLVRGLYLAVQVLETGLPVVVAMNMMDEARAAGLEVDAEALGQGLGAKVVPMVASTGEGRDELVAAIGEAAGQMVAPDPWAGTVTPEVLELLAPVEEAAAGDSPGARRSQALWAALSLGDGDELEGVPDALRAAAAAARQRAEAAGVDLDLEVVGRRYRFLEDLASRCVTAPETEAETWTDRIDAVLTHRVWGALVFCVVMLGLFQALFAWCDPLIGVVEEAVGGAQGLVSAWLPAGALRDLLVHGVIAGVGNVVVFVPQIAALFLILGFLEDCGYLARVAFLIDRVMGGVGLHGKAFVPMLSGMACAIPAAMATRTIESRLDRILTMVTLPLMSCSARLPVYVLLTAAVFPPEAKVFGVLSVGAVVLASMYALSVAATLVSAAVLRRTLLAGPRPPLVLELPPYRLPLARNLAYATWRRVKKFLVDAGTVILAMTILLWVLLTYPKLPEAREAELAAGVQRIEAQLEAGDALGDERKAALEEALAAAQGRASQARLEASYAGRLGRTVEPVFRPLGFDWRISIGVIGSFAAREVFVSTMGVVFGIEEADEGSTPLRQALREAKTADGQPLMTPLVGICLMIFFVLACQCMSTLAVLKKESGGWKWPLITFAYMSALAYGLTLVVYQVGSALGY